MTPEIMWAAFFGFVGGLIRGLIGLVKFFQRNKRDRKLKLGTTIFSVLVVCLVGAVAGALSEANWQTAFVVGYAGSDFIESLYKIKTKQGLQI